MHEGPVSLHPHQCVSGPAFQLVAILAAGVACPGAPEVGQCCVAALLSLGRLRSGFASLLELQYRSFKDCTLPKI